MLDYHVFLPYIDIESGLRRVNDNHKLYLNLLNSFLAYTDTTPLESLLYSKNFDSASQYIHSIKGVALNLSLIKASEILKQVELAVKTQSDYLSLLDVLKDCLIKTKDMIKKLSIILIQ